MAELSRDRRKGVLLRLDPELLARVDEAAGDVPRQRWIVGRLEEALGGPGRRRDSEALGGSATEGTTPPASPRASSEPPEPYRLEAERQAVKEAIEAGATGVEIEVGSSAPPAPIVPQLPAYRCRIASCDWAGADSPAARCSRHPGPTVKR